MGWAGGWGVRGVGRTFGGGSEDWIQRGLDSIQRGVGFKEDCIQFNIQRGLDSKWIGFVARCARKMRGTMRSIGGRRRGVGEGGNHMQTIGQGTGLVDGTDDLRVHSCDALQAMQV